MPTQWKFPFQIGSDGRIATVEQGSDRQIEDALAITALTVQGERVMARDFGVPDPAFAGGLTADDIQASVNAYGPDGVRVTSVDQTPVDSRTVRADVQWEREVL